MLVHFLRREHAPNPGDEARQRPRELRIVVRRLCEIQQVLPDDGIEGRPDAVAHAASHCSIQISCQRRSAIARSSIFSPSRNQPTKAQTPVRNSRFFQMPWLIFAICGIAFGTVCERPSLHLTCHKAHQPHQPLPVNDQRKNRFRSYENPVRQNHIVSFPARRGPKTRPSP